MNRADSKQKNLRRFPRPQKIYNRPHLLACLRLCRCLHCHQPQLAPSVVNRTPPLQLQAGMSGRCDLGSDEPGAQAAAASSAGRSSAADVAVCCGRSRSRSPPLRSVVVRNDSQPAVLTTLGTAAAEMSAADGDWQTSIRSETENVRRQERERWHGVLDQMRAAWALAAAQAVRAQRVWHLQQSREDAQRHRDLHSDIRSRRSCPDFTAGELAEARQAADLAFHAVSEERMRWFNIARSVFIQMERLLEPSGM